MGGFIVKKITTDGNTAAAMASYATNELAIIYPITPSSPMAEACDEWANAGKLNIYNKPMKITEMQSEGGAAGALHGSLLAGATTTTFTASQGLLLMIPNMYKIAGEMLPCVFNVAARSLATHALSIFGDHSDVMACRQTGFCMIASRNVQECFDLELISMMTTLNSSMPVLHFFDGFRTSHEINKISVLEDKEIRKLIPQEKILEFKARALNPNSPTQFGTAQNPDVFFQNREASEIFYRKLPERFVEACHTYYALTGRYYAPFTYYGAKNAENIVVAMCSSTETIERVIDDFNKKNDSKAGLVIVRLYRPFVTKAFVDAIPNSTKIITVLDRTKEGGSAGEPLYLDVCASLREHYKNIPVLCGRYGLGGKDFTPANAYAVLQNMIGPRKNHFTVGIKDDITKTNLPETHYTLPFKGTQCLFYGLGSDGTVSANKNSIKIIGDNTKLNAQGYFVYDSKKSGSVTISHLRFGAEPITQPYEIDIADFIACHNARYIGKYDFLPKLKDGGTLLLNCDWQKDEIATKLPANFKRELAERNINFYIINAQKIADELGLRGKINTIMQSAFFRLAKIIPYDNAVLAMKAAAKKSYGKAGDAVVEQNYRAIEKGGEMVQKIDVPREWAKDKSEITTQFKENKEQFAYDIMSPIAELKGNDLATSKFTPDGHIPTDTAKFEKRGIATNIPCWQKQNCIQCNMCSFVCPHGAIKPVLIDEDTPTPDEFECIKATGYQNKKFRIQISPLDCTGCGSCVNVCPAREKALIMKNGEEEIKNQRNNYLVASEFENNPSDYNKFSVKGSQFAPTMFQFNGACAGCGETPYIKLATQLFGDKMIIANATGCSSIYGGSYPSCPYTRNLAGHGPAWANSLFEDNAEFGLGMRIALDNTRENLSNALEKIAESLPNLEPLIEEWQSTLDLDSSQKISNKLCNALQDVLINESVEKELTEKIKEILNSENDLNQKTVWIIGGDGWAYDIGYGGLDHVLASGKNVNILVLDSQVYSNTGGQASKATPMGAVAKFADGGKVTSKKNLGLMAMSYPDVYVAQISLGANMNQALTAIKEAQEYNGVSIVIAYSTCINHGIDMSQGMLVMREAVQSGYWHLFRYNPITQKLILDSPEPTLDYIEFAKKQRRFANLYKKDPVRAEELLQKSKQDSLNLREKLKKLSQE